MDCRVIEIKFKKRQRTDKIIILEADLGGMSFEELLKEHLRKGDFFVDVHFYVDVYGRITIGRRIESLSGFAEKEAQDSIYIMADIDRELNDSQKYSMRKLINTLNEIYKKKLIIIIRRKEA